MIDKIKKRILEHKEVIEFMSEVNLEVIEKAAKAIIHCYNNNKKLIIFGNGGSSADSSHIAGEFLGRYTFNRKSLPAIAVTDLAAITAIANDFGYEHSFERYVEGLASEGDIAIGISTSGNSANVIKAIDTAKSKGVLTIAFTGRDGGKIKNHADIVLRIPSNDIPRIQEGYMLAAHIICELVESMLFSPNHNWHNDT